MHRIGFIGAGNMARALGGGLAGAGSGEARFELIATDPVAEALDGFRTATGGRAVAELGALAAEADVLVLSVKPQVLPAVLEKLAPVVRGDHLVLSIVAGVPLKGLARSLGAEVRTVRAMPNTPSLVRRGITALVAGPTARPEDVQLAEAVFASVGEVVVLDDEKLLDAVTAVSGSGPGFLFAYAEAMLEAAQAVGLDETLALRLVRETILGSAVLWKESGEEASVLRARVTSPGGTTQAGLEALDSRGFARAVRAAVESATRRSRELSAG